MPYEVEVLPLFLVSYNFYLFFSQLVELLDLKNEAYVNVE